MTDAQTEAAAVTEPIAAAPQEKPADEGMLEHAKSTVGHAIETIVDKVTETLGHIGGRK
jgi:hypothetical protein